MVNFGRFRIFGGKRADVPEVVVPVEESPNGPYPAHWDGIAVSEVGINDARMGARYLADNLEREMFSGYGDQGFRYQRRYMVDPSGLIRGLPNIPTEVRLNNQILMEGLEYGYALNTNRTFDLRFSIIPPYGSQAFLEFNGPNLPNSVNTPVNTAVARLEENREESVVMLQRFLEQMRDVAVPTAFGPMPLSTIISAAEQQGLKPEYLHLGQPAIDCDPENQLGRRKMVCDAD
jgi:hypothetical protein